jgi:hypothetical protein
MVARKKLKHTKKYSQTNIRLTNNLTSNTARYVPILPLCYVRTNELAIGYLPMLKSIDRLTYGSLHLIVVSWIYFFVGA